MAERSDISIKRLKNGSRSVILKVGALEAYWGAAIPQGGAGGAPRVLVAKHLTNIKS